MHQDIRWQHNPAIRSWVTGWKQLFCTA